VGLADHAPAVVEPRSEHAAGAGHEEPWLGDPRTQVVAQELVERRRDASRVGGVEAVALDERRWVAVERRGDDGGGCVEWQ